MQENLDFLTTLEIDNHEFTSVSLNLLTKLFKVSTHIKILKITNSHFPSPDSFCLLCNSLQNNTCLQELNLSKNNLTDNYGMYICDLIVNSSSIKEVILDLNLFKNTDFGQCFSVSAIELISINNNPLSEAVVLSILSSCTSNKNLKSLNIHGKMAQGEIFEMKLAEVLESTKLVKLGFDLSFKSLEVLKSIEKSLSNSNKSLVVFVSDFINWDDVNESHPAFPLKKALLANMWFYSQDILNLEKYEELFKELQGIVQKKINKEEIYPKDERKVAATPDFKENTGKSSYEISKLVSNSGSFAYSDSSFIETREKAILNLEERVKFHSLNDCYDMHNKKLDKLFVKLEGSIGLLEERIEKLEKLNQNHLAQNKECEQMKVIQEFTDFEKKLEEKFEILSEEIGNRLAASYSNSPIIEIPAINEEIIKIQEKVEYNSDEIKQLEMKLEKQYFHVKSTFKKLNSVYANQTQLQTIESRIETTELKLEELIEKTISTEDKSSNLFLEIENLTKAFQNIQRNISESERKLKEFHSNLSSNEEKVNNSLKIRDLIKLRDEEIYQKIYSLECEILEVKNSDKFEKLNNELQKIEFKLSQVEEVCQKNQENNCFQFTEQNLLINELQQKVLNIHLPLSGDTCAEQSLALEILTSECNSILKSPQDKFDYSKSLATRLEKLEKLNIHKKALEVAKNYEDEFDFVPAHAESLVRTAVLEKVNKFSGKSNTLAYRTIGPYSQKLSSSFLDDDSHMIEKSSRRYDYKSFYNS